MHNAQARDTPLKIPPQLALIISNFFKIKYVEHRRWLPWFCVNYITSSCRITQKPLITPP